MHNGEGLARRSGAVSVCTALAVLSGFALDVLLIARFGTGSKTDAFFAAYTTHGGITATMKSRERCFIALFLDEMRE
jgi:peptidoglycan biosynthesis protein MviN/MurJ (putative lipid II flippase)